MRARDIISELCLDILHKEATFASADAEYDFEHPKNTYTVSCDGVSVGYLSVPHPIVTQNIDKKCAIAYFEINTEKFATVKAGVTAYSEPSKFPAIDIDVTFSVDLADVNFDKLTLDAKTKVGEILSDVKVKDIYTADGVTALTLRFSFVSRERTLTKQELTPAIEAIVSAIGLEVKA